MVPADILMAEYTRKRIGRRDHNSLANIGYRVPISRKGREQFRIHTEDSDSSVGTVPREAKLISVSAGTGPRQNKSGVFGVARRPTLVDVNHTPIRRTRSNRRLRSRRQASRRQSSHRYSVSDSAADQALRGYLGVFPEFGALMLHSSLERQLALHGVKRAIAPVGIPTADTTVRGEELGAATPHPELADATSHEEVATLLRSAGLHALAQELDDVRDLAVEDQEQRPMDVESLKTFAEFMLKWPRLATASIGVNEDGFVDAQWFLSSTIESGYVAPDDRGFWGDGRGMLVVIFLPNGMARFAANSGPAVGGKIRLRKSATCSLEMIPNELASFWRRLITQ